MNVLMAAVVGIIYAGAIFLLLSRNMSRLIIGVVLLGHATNLLLLVSGSLSRGQPPIIPTGQSVLVSPFANPLTQALILTAIVIGLGLQAFVLVLLRRTMQSMGTEDVQALQTAER